VKVLLIPEDQTLDGFITKPVIEALLADIKVSARVDVLPEPRLRGAGDALDPSVVRSIVADNPMTDLFVLIVDRDCDRQGHEAKARARQSEHPGKLVACVAVQELEVWMLALYKDQLHESWQNIRAHCDPKEQWAEPLLKKLGSAGPGAGRKRAMQALKGKLKTLLSLCDELNDLRNRLQAFRKTSG
jgi:hypothetical protein